MTDIFAEAAVALGRSAELSIITKATVVVALGLVAARMTRRARASVRHLLIGSTFGALLGLPLAAAVFPARTIEVALAGVGDRVASPAPTRASGGEVRAALPAASTGRSVVQSRSSGASPLRRMTRAGWMTGTTLLLGSFAIALWRLSRIRRRGLPWPAGRALIAELTPRAGLNRPVEILLHEEITAPVTCGFRHPAILLPCDAPDWNAEDLRRAIVHDWSTCAGPTGRCS